MSQSETFDDFRFDVLCVEFFQGSLLFTPFAQVLSEDCSRGFSK